MKEDLYTSLIHKNLSGDISPKEQQELNAWLQESTDHQVIADHIRQTWKWSANFNTEVDLDLEADFAQLQKKVSADAKPKPQVATERTLPKRNNWWAMAAGLLFLVVGGFVFRQFFQGQPEIKIASTTAGQTIDLQLADGTRISLNENSSLHYPTAFKAGERRVELKGEAFFEVAKDPGKTFIVSSPNSEVRVLGTVFSVEDYDQSDFVTVAVQEGKVQLQGKGKRDQLILTAKEQGLYQKGKNLLVKKQNQSLNNQAWHTQRLVYKGETLTEVLEDLNDLFKVQIQLENPALAECPFSGTFNKQSIEAVLQTISGVFGMSVEKSEENNYSLAGGNCNF